jgi:hypothetical protein
LTNSGITGKKSQQQRANVRAVHIGIGHDNDAAVTELGDVECPLLVAASNPGADGRDHGLDLGILKHLVESGLLDVDEFASNRQNGDTGDRDLLPDPRPSRSTMPLGKADPVPNSQLAFQEGLRQLAFANGLVPF